MFFPPSNCDFPIRPDYNRKTAGLQRFVFCLLCKIHGHAEKIWQNPGQYAKKLLPYFGFVV
jgi:hypothetical protein